jgi:hypothetical protein
MRVSQTQAKNKQAQGYRKTRRNDHEEGVGTWIVSSIGSVFAWPLSLFRLGDRSGGEYMSIPDAYYDDNEDEDAVKR